MVSCVPSLIYGQGRIPADPEIDFRVDETKLQACLEAEAGQEIEAVAALRCHAAQHHTLAVVALLHAGIKIAVQVKGKKIFLQQFQRAFLRQPSRIQIRLQIGASYTDQNAPVYCGNYLRTTW